MRSMLVAAMLCLAGGARASEPFTHARIGGTLPTDESDCAGCHPDVAAQWAASAHRFSSFDNPYYRVSVEAFRKERGRPASRFCAGCHEPVLLSTGAVDREIDVKAPAARAGVGCLLCHSVEAADVRGNASYTANVGPIALGKHHRERFRKAILDDAKLCGACHKVGLEPSITRDRFLRGQDDYDAWQAASASGNGAGAVLRAATVSACQGCHMPLEPATRGDAGAHGGMIRSHRFAAANAALPALRGDEAQAARVRAFLDGAVALDLFFDGGDAVVVMANRRVGHRFPGGTNDSNEVWLELEARDAKGALLGRSGRGADGALMPDAHLVRAQPVDGAGQPLPLRDPQHMRGVAFDTSLAPADPQAVRFRLPTQTVRVEAHLYYRKFSPAYAKAACTFAQDDRRAACEAVPTVELARAVRTIGEPDRPDYRALVERGLALSAALVEAAPAALPWLERAIAMQPKRAEPLIAEARLFTALGRTDDAVAAARKAEAWDPKHPGASFWAATALTRAYRYAEARPFAERLAQLLPADRAALSLVARVRGVLGAAAEALSAADAIVALDPFLDEGHYQRALALAELGRGDEADRARAAYLYHRVATEIDLTLRDLLNARRAGLPDESVPLHTHTLH